ncbi:MAG: winged helix-turn-helix transcriptional regulator [Gammaproteobacteria bacterium]|nr:winged helix-turn-helix transcriptional regulator [Gammaproteobacteria bacterium]
MNEPDKEAAVTLGILKGIEQEKHVTQRGLADQLGIALGLANLYLKRCVRKGLVKVQQAPANRYAYYLTPKGFAEKSRLTGEYLRYSFGFYRDISDSVARSFAAARQAGYQRVVFAGVSELAEVALLKAREHGIEAIGIVDADDPRDHFHGLPVWRELPAESSYDCCLVTALNAPSETCAALLETIDASGVLIPDVLGVQQQDDLRGD